MNHSQSFIPEDHNIVLTKDLRRKLKAEILRTGVTPRIFFEKSFFLNAPDLPERLTFQVINEWVRGEVDPVLISEIEYVLKKFSILADDAGRIAADGTLLPRRGRKFQKIGEDWIDVTMKMATLIKEEFVRTGFDVDTILVDAVNIPERLNARIIRGWLYGDAKKTNIEFWNYVVKRLAAMPDRAGPLPRIVRKPRKIAKNTPAHELISEEQRIMLRHHRERTGLGGATLLRGAIDKPQGLTDAVISSWLVGRTLTAQPEHIAYVLKLYEAKPSKVK